MQRVFTVNADPGHAWGKISIDVIEALGLTEGHFTNYSYRLGRYLYLEEDCDLSLFVKVYREKTGNTPEWRELHSNKRSRIRNYLSVRSDPTLQQKALA